MLSLPPWAQTVGAVLGAIVTIVLLVLVSLPRWGRVLRDRGRALLAVDPASVEGLELVARGTKFLRIGSDLRALRDSPAGQRLPAPMRLILDSIPEDSEPPPAPTTTPSIRRLPPPLPLFCMGAAIAASGCVEAQRQMTEQLDNAADVVRAGAELADFAEPRLRALYEVELKECLKNPTVAEAERCVEAVRKVYGPAKASIATIRAVRCAARHEPACDEGEPAWGEPSASSTP